MSKKAKPTKRDLEKKFSDTAFRLSQERNDFLLPQVLDFVVERKWINLRPEYQRRLVWDVPKRSLFIESLLLNIPIPPLFLYEKELGRYEVMDGQQRLNAVLDFYKGGYGLKGLERWHELNGMTYEQLPQTLQRGLDRRRLSATVLLVENTMGSASQRSDIRKLVFERLNTGGLTLNAQELRNCLYDGPFNKLLIELARTSEFADAWDIPRYEENVDKHGVVNEALGTDRLYRRMLDCEIVLRFFAFRRRARIKGSVKSMLDSLMESSVTISQEEVASLKSDFLTRLELATGVFGANAFKFRDENKKWRYSQPLYDAQMVAIDVLWDKRAKLMRSRTAIRKSVSSLLDDEDAFGVIVGRPNTAKAIAQRIDLVVDAINSAIR